MLLSVPAGARNVAGDVHNLPRTMRRLLCFNEPVCGGVYSPLAVLLRTFVGTFLTCGASGSYGDFYRAFRHGDEC